MQDGTGHGTHVAGIVAGIWPAGPPPQAYNRQRDEQGAITCAPVAVPTISGIAPQCKLVSLKVMDAQGQGEASSLIAAIGLIQEINGYGRRLLIHGVNMSVGYDFDPEWFAAGREPALRGGRPPGALGRGGGSGGRQHRLRRGPEPVQRHHLSRYEPDHQRPRQRRAGHYRGLDAPRHAPRLRRVLLLLQRPHRRRPRQTRPGGPRRKILSCAAGEKRQEMTDKTLQCDYLEDSGTSMAAPHVSGAIAAFLSIRREFIGEPEKVKDLFLTSATDLKRERYFQGCGLVDLMRAIQSV
ncbi:MAG: S8 family serine peptidase [Hymenobacter sp.]